MNTGDPLAKGRTTSRPRRFGRYVVKRVLGRGAMGVVYLAEDPLIGRDIAVKAIKALEALAPNELADVQERFEHEFRSAGTMSHPNIVMVLDVGQEDDSSYIAMEFINGQTLDQQIADEGKLPWQKIIRLVRGIGSALDYAHEQGVIHRDIKPANILIDAEDHPKITDFGVAKLASSTLTRAGSIIGTPAYMSPEQITGQALTGTSDQFSLAVVLYEMLTGKQPFYAESPTSTLYKIVHQSPIAPRELDRTLPQAIDAVLMRALEKDPQKRFRSCQGLADALGRAFDPAARRAAPAVKSKPTATRAKAKRTIAGNITANLRNTILAKTVMLRTRVTTRQPDRKISGQSSEAVPQTGSTLTSRRRLAIAAVIGIAILVIGVWAIPRMLASSPTLEPLTATPVPEAPAVKKLTFLPEPSVDIAPEGPAPTTRVSTVTVVSDPSGLEIWIDGQVSGYVTPFDVEIAGEIGETHRLELRRDGRTLAENDFTIGEPIGRQWAPTIVVTQPFIIETRPPGAQVTFDGERQPGVTPLEVDVDPHRVHAIQVHLEGYKPLPWNIDYTQLTSEQIDSRALRFLLAPDQPPAVLVLGAQYDVRLTIEGRSYGPFMQKEIELAPDTYEITASAPDVYYEETFESIELRSDERHMLPLPRLVSIDITAYPEDCIVTIDGRQAGEIVDLFGTVITAGRHTIHFEWSSGKAIEKQYRIEPEGVFDSGQNIGKEIFVEEPQGK